MGSPIDRTAKSALDSNLVNGVTSDAPKVKANNDVVYNYADGLNNALTTHADATTLPHADSSVTGPKIRDGAVTTAKLADLAVTRPKIAVGAVGSSQLDPTLLTNFGDIATQAEFDRRGVNVMKFGAVGDDSANDTVAFQAALDYCCANNVALYIPTGTYKVNDLHIDAYIHMFGSSSTLSILHYVGTETCLKIGDNINYPTQPMIKVNLHDFKITGDVITDPLLRTAKSGVMITRTVGSKFERLVVEYFKEGGFNIWGKATDPNQAGNSVFNNIFNKVNINSCKYGFNIRGVVSDSYFSEGQMNNIDDYGFYFNLYNPGWNVNIDKYTCVVSKKSVFVDNVIMRNLSIKGCNFEQFSENGVLINGVNPTGCSVVTISNNTFYSKSLGTEECIKADFADLLNINSNVFTNPVLRDINLTTNCTSGIVFNNKAMTRSIIVSISKTNTYFRYGFTSSQDVTTFDNGISVKAGDFITETAGSGVIVKSPNGSITKRISVSDNGGVSVKNADGTGSTMELGLKGTTVERQALVGLTSGIMYYDTTLQKPLWSKSNFPMVWIDATGTVVP